MLSTPPAANGNLIVISLSNLGTGLQRERLYYDAWNRLVRVEHVKTGATDTVWYGYNGLHWKVYEHRKVTAYHPSTSPPGAPPVQDTVRWSFYSPAWQQLLEVVAGWSATPPTHPTATRRDVARSFGASPGTANTIGVLVDSAIPMLGIPAAQMAGKPMLAPDGLVGSPAKTSTAAHPTFEPGPFAGESIPARSSAQAFTAAERAEMNRIGQQTGCHTCGTTTPGTKSGNFVPDHQPVSALSPRGTPQRLYPQCLDCSDQQGLAAMRYLKNRQP